MKANHIREEFLKFFAQEKKLPHKIIPSASLIPAQDASVLFSIAGMQQFKQFFLGGATDAKKTFGTLRLTSTQKCFRVNDIDEVGDDSHLTYFEMLGNFSIGDYFKKEAIDLAWRFTTKILRIPKENLVVTYFAGDTTLRLPEDVETKNLWSAYLPKEKIIARPASETFWGPPGKSGPCGPSTEIHYAPKGTSLDSGALEIWNIVLMQYEKTPHGIYKELPQKNIDTGMGLERVAMITEKVTSPYETSLLKPLAKKILSDPAFGKSQDVRRLRIATDHLRASVMLLADDVVFGKKEQQAVLRRVFRKALDQYELRNANVSGVLDAVVKIYKDIFPAIVEKREHILSAMQEEQMLYQATRERKVSDFLKKIRHSSTLVSQTEPLHGPSARFLSPEEAFTLHTTYGFSLEQLTQEGYTFDQDTVMKKISDHKALSKEGAIKKFGGHGLGTIHEDTMPEDAKKAITKLHTATHLLHASLRKILGANVKQEGSDITPERLRFDFAFPRKLTEEEKKEIENQINDIIKKGYAVTQEHMPLQEALSKGALAFFREKYPDMVSVYTVIHPHNQDVFSRELCGGPHVQNTSEIGSISIFSEKSIAKGIRRIKAKII